MKKAGDVENKIWILKREKKIGKRKEKQPFQHKISFQLLPVFFDFASTAKPDTFRESFKADEYVLTLNLYLHLRKKKKKKVSCILQKILKFKKSNAGLP